MRVRARDASRCAIKPIEEAFGCKRDRGIGRSRPGPSGHRTNASQRPTDSPTYIRKFAPTFSHTWAVVVGSVARNRIATADLLASSFFSLSLFPSSTLTSLCLPSLYTSQLSTVSCGTAHFCSFLSVSRASTSVILGYRPSSAPQPLLQVTKVPRFPRLSHPQRWKE